MRGSNEVRDEGKEDKKGGERKETCRQGWKKMMRGENDNEEKERVKRSDFTVQVQIV